MKKFNIKQFSKEINFPYHTLLRIYNKYECTTKEELLQAIEQNKKFHIGDKFGRVTIISDDSELRNSQTHVKVRCDCGKEYYVPLSDLKNGRRQACTQCRSISKRTSINKGDKFGDWTVLSEPIKGIFKNNLVYLCKCTCGNIQYCKPYDLKTGKTTRCFKCSRKVGVETMMIHNGKIGELNINKYNKIKRTTTSRGIEFNVSLKYLWDLFLKQERKCAITGDYISDFSHASLDRINSDIGYTEGNVQWTTYRANISKHTMTMSELYEFCKKVLNHANQQPSQPLTKLEGSETN